ncbi:Arylesterase [Caulifigura coniformis]|uniref:Arylesterase n=1 Tax=Caulifigura coniformis TaxID=2527983 RepID=A0A517S7Q2_9PLAN|nr:alpha/beta fold hydrolase [Caulifigura coniformis]QDT52145.1 Arylesterase [Caulifigura coniformis]
MQQMIDTSRGSFSVDDSGEGTPLVLLHGFPLDHSMWKDQIARFSSTHRVVALDLRGFGKSPPRNKTVTMAEFADDVAAVIKAMKLGPVVLCGLSMGGYIAFAFQENHRDLLKGLILCDTRSLADMPEAAKARRVTAERVLKEGTSFLADTMLPKLFAEKTALTRPEIVDATRRVIESANPAGVSAAARGMAERRDYSDDLAGMDIPCLVIVGEHDAISPADEMTTIANRMPQAELKVIPNAGHMAPLENPPAVNEAIEAFLEQLG